MASVKVAVRVRPFNQRESNMGAQLIIQMQDKTTGILNSKANVRDENIRYKEFTFDYSYWSHDPNGVHYASQEKVYNDLGTEVLDCAFQGYNACVFAYGQTGSGKTYTMMGSEDNQGIIPRICKSLFEKMSENSKRGITHRVQVSYLEIYQERVADLLRADRGNSLKVREHPKKGPYVQGLTTYLVTSYNHIEDCMKRGNSHRTTASTNMNDVSSRSHAIFTITFVQAGYCDGVPSETVSKIHLVDLAGSERADLTGATGQRLKEGAHINKSLVTLGSVISTLAELSVDQSNQKKNSVFIPYRDSVLTWLLKDSLGGNSKTIMIAAISPADCNYGETLSTLRYANRAKNIINKPTVNEDPNVKLIRELRNEISKLRALMFCEQRSDMLAQLHEKEAREKELTEEWAGKWREAQAILREQKALGLRKSGPGVVLDSDRPHLVAIDDDPLTTGVTLYHLKEGKTSIGTEDSAIKPDIQLKGAGMESQHCTITLENGVTTLTPHPGAYVVLNNQVLESSARLSQGCIIFLGKAHVFRFNDPAEAAELRKGERSYNLSRLSLLSWSTPDLAVSMENLDNGAEDEKSDIETKRLSLVKNEEPFEEEQEDYDKREEILENRRKTLEEAQAALEKERILMQKLHADQTRRLNEDWRILTEQQNQRVLELKNKERELILQREQLEKERQEVLTQINQECKHLQNINSQFLTKLSNSCQLLLSATNGVTLPSPQSKQILQEFINRPIINGILSATESDYIIDILNKVAGSHATQNLLNIHKKELFDMQEELKRRVEELSQHQKSVQSLDQRLISLVNDQESLNDGGDRDVHLEHLKSSLGKRSEEELKKIEAKKQGLSLNLKKINSCDDSSSPAVTSMDTEEKGTLSSDTYHTAPNSSFSPLDILSESEAELKRPSLKYQDDTDLSSDEDKVKNSDSQSTSSVELNTPTSANKKRDTLALRKIAHKISQLKQLILKNLENGCPKDELDNNIASLQDLQKQYMSIKCSRPSTLLPVTVHPLQAENNHSPILIRSLQRGLSTTLHSPQLNHTLTSQHQSFYRSLPSIPTDTDCGSVISIPSYYLRGAGNKTHYEYEVRICTSDDHWIILRRYSRFRDLHIAMKAKYKDKVSSIPFPPKTLFANTESVAKSRRLQLECYVRILLERCKNHPLCPLSYSGPVTKSDLITFSPFFKKGVFENGKYGTS